MSYLNINLFGNGTGKTTISRVIADKIPAKVAADAAFGVTYQQEGGQPATGESHGR